MRVRNQAAPLFAFAVTAFFALGAPQKVSACAACCLTHCTPPPVQHCHCDQYCDPLPSGRANPGEARVVMVSASRATIEIPNYVTTDGEVCEMAVPPIDGISRINQVRMVDPITKRPLENYSWLPNAAPSGDFSNLAADAGLALGDQRWESFVSQVKGGPTAEGRLYSFILDVTLEEGTTSRDLVRALRSQGFIATGSADQNGTFDLQNLFLRSFGQGNVELYERERPGKQGHNGHSQN